MYTDLDTSPIHRAIQDAQPIAASALLHQLERRGMDGSAIRRAIQRHIDAGTIVLDSQLRLTIP